MYKKTEADLNAAMKADWLALKQYIQANHPEIVIVSDSEAEINPPQLDWGWCERPYSNK
jgi:hypothetical protein